MSNFNAVVGSDQSTLNDLSQQIYQALYPKFFQREVIINKPLIYAVNYNFTQAPQFDFSSTERALAAVKNSLCFDKADKDLMSKVNDFIETQIAVFTLEINQLEITYFPAENIIGKPFTVSIEADCQFDISSTGIVYPAIISAALKLPDHPDIEKLLNEFFVPIMVDYLNKLLEDGFQLPSFGFAGANFSPPVARIEDETLTAFAALAPGPSQFPGLYDNWPKNNLFIMFDKEVAKVVTDKKLASTQKSDSAPFKVDIGICTLKLEASYWVGVTDSQYTFNPDNSLTVAVTAYGGGSAQAKCGFLKPQLGMQISAAPKITAKIAIVNNEVIIIFEKVDDIKVNLHFTGVPGWMEAVLSSVISFFSTKIAQLIGDMLTGLQIPVYPLPNICFTTEGVTLCIRLNNQLVSVVTGPDDKMLASITSKLQITT